MNHNSGNVAPATAFCHRIPAMDYLLRTQNADGLWDQDHYTGAGFPRVLYLRYHG